MMFSLHLKSLALTHKIINPKMSISVFFKHKEKIILQESSAVTATHIQVYSLLILSMSQASGEEQDQTLDHSWPAPLAVYLHSCVCRQCLWVTLLPVCPTAAPASGTCRLPSQLSCCPTAALTHNAAPHLRTWSVASHFLPRTAHHPLCHPQPGLSSGNFSLSTFIHGRSIQRFPFKLDFWLLH